jgi:DNA polymerase III epsilon subunit-like protein
MKAVLDLETGGFSITKNAVCEIGILIVNDELEVVLERSFIIKPYTRPDSDELVSYKEDAMAIHGISMEEIEAGEIVTLVCEAINEMLIANNVTSIIGHNIKLFDFRRIEYLFDRFTQHNFYYELEDTLELSRKHLNLSCNKLSSVCDHFKIDHLDRHRALGDCKATLEVYKELSLIII